MSRYEELKKTALEYGVFVLTKRLERLKKRKLVLFPWLRIHILTKRIEKLKSLL